MEMGSDMVEMDSDLALDSEMLEMNNDIGEMDSEMMAYYRKTIHHRQQLDTSVKNQLFGQSSFDLCKLENLLQVKFDEFCSVYAPNLWPCIPLKLPPVVSE
ncbi:unnamed protein product [Soboliphyme baturini]|uniref:KNOX2 domain-containing protein n=1 Tax=Soboliphyme baturini TaxID=241478 RepID=A0A183J5D0_9BILA|nr:unnamed protein product [Soboliphyme baturini]